ncbi:3219_t:CDS:2 [Dentiscutata erythropus]|uniref:3219_t:CDS:1 n=1 Tax=Dentiscutata erythropus TaxID=1348616 RepID=A0A9N8ZHS8_9GLOM|nr:3219_t:CDS:2 [Dentiscutata erythropus]
MAVKNKSGSSTSNPTSLITGTTVLPIARVKRIIKEDDEITMCSADATFVIAVAAELFVGHFAKQGLEKANTERRKNILYRDLANAVKDQRHLEFLQSVVPQTCKFEKALKAYNDAMKQHEATKALNDANSDDESSDDNCEKNGADIGRQNNDDQSNDDLDMISESGQDTSESNTDDLDSVEENGVNSDDSDNNSPIHNGNNNEGNGISDSELSDAPTSSNENGSA